MSKVLITGGSHGIGSKTALAFAREGYNITITYKDSKEAAEKVVRCRENYVECEAIHLDISDDSSDSEGG